MQVKRDMNTRELHIMPFKEPENYLDIKNIKKAWEAWLEEAERQFRFCKINNPADKKDALLIYGGKQLVLLENCLPDALENLDEYETLKKKLNDYYLPRRNKHYERFLFLNMRPKPRESTRSYVARLREKANTCEFLDTYDDRILEHLVQTVENEVLIHKCLRKCWTLEQFLEEAKEFESTNLQVSEIKRTQQHSVAKVYKKYRGRRYWTQETGRWPRCKYCGLSGVHPKGQNCPAYNKRCFKCSKMDHFAAVCWTRQRRIFEPYIFCRSKMSCFWTKRRNGRMCNTSMAGPDCASVGHVRVKTAKVVPKENRKMRHVRVKTAKVVPEENKKVGHVSVKTAEVVPEENRKVGHVRVKTAKVVTEDNRKLETSDIFETYPKVAEPAAEEETIDTVMPQADYKTEDDRANTFKQLGQTCRDLKAAAKEFQIIAGRISKEIDNIQQSFKQMLSSNM